MQLDHVQLAIPPGAEARCLEFWLAAGFVEQDKPEALRGRGGLWLRAGRARLHLGVEADFRPARKAHPAFASSALDGLAEALATAGANVTWDEAIAGRRRFFTADPVGNRVEFIEEAAT